MLPTAITSAPSEAQPSASESASTLGRDDFLRMLVAQLENQDPLNPQDATEFTAQLAQFSSLEQLLSIDGRLQEVADSQRALGRALETTASTALIDRHVVVSDDRFEIATGGGFVSTPGFELDAASSATSVRIRNAQGSLVGALELGPLGQGLHRIPADLLENAGLSAGVYRFEVSAESAGQPVTATPRFEGPVTGAIPSSSNPMILVGELLVPYAQISEIRQREPGS